MVVEVPEVVGFYRLGAEGMQRVAVFRRAQGGVSLEVLDERWGDMARRYSEEGILLYRTGTVVTAEQPDLFFEALLEPRNMTYYQFRRED